MSSWRPYPPASIFAVLGFGAVGLTVLVAAAPAQVELGTEPQLALGKQMYEKWCSQCHGEQGDGQGYAAKTLKPAPRDFRPGKYKIRQTPTGFLPTDDDIRRVIRRGIPSTGMPAFADLAEDEVTGLVFYLKSFSDDFADPEAYAEPLDIPAAPPYDESNVEIARQVYEEIGCARCHGREGHGDGTSAPTLVDDWGQHIRAADLSRPWTFRGGGAREEIYRAISTGFNGTPMAGFDEALTPEQRWQLVDFITSLSGGAMEPGYANLLTAVPVEGEIDLEQGRELFAPAPSALFPLFGQIVQPGRAYHPGVIAVEAKAVFTRDEIAFLLTWHDIQANSRGFNAPDLEVTEEVLKDQENADGGDEGDFWGDEADDGEEEGFWGEEEDPAADEGFWGEEADTSAEDDFWGEDEGGEEEDFWEEGESEDAAVPSADTSEYSDAVALQFPRELDTGIRKPYFLFGDPQHPVELWYIDLSRPEEGQLWEARGSDSLSRSDGTSPAVVTSYADGEWSVIFKRSRRPDQGIAFAPETFVPISFSVWDGFFGERGNHRGLSAWYHVYVPAIERPSPLLPMAKTAAMVFLAELLVIGLVRFRHREAPTLEGKTTDGRKS